MLRGDSCWSYFGCNLDWQSPWAQVQISILVAHSPCTIDSDLKIYTQMPCRENLFYDCFRTSKQVPTSSSKLLEKVQFPIRLPDGGGASARQRLQLQWVFIRSALCRSFSVEKAVLVETPAGLREQHGSWQSQFYLIPQLVSQLSSKLVLIFSVYTKKKLFSFHFSKQYI